MGGKNAPGELPPEFIDSYVNTNQFAEDIANNPFQEYTGQGVAGPSDLQNRSYDMGLNMVQNGVGRGALQDAIGITKDAARYDPNDVNSRNYNAAQIHDAQFQDAATADRTSANFQAMDAAQMGRAETSRSPEMEVARLGDFDRIKSAEMDAARLADFDRSRASDAEAARVREFERAKAVEADNARINRSNISNVGANSIADANIKDYADPYETRVIDRGLEDIERGRQMSQQNDKAEAIAARAFGGSREGVQRALTSEAYDKNRGDFVAQQRQAGFGQAAGMAQSDADRRLQAQLANQQADISVYGQNAGFKQQTELQNAQLKTGTNQFNSSGTATGDQLEAQMRQQAELQNAQNQTQNNQFNASGTAAQQLAEAQMRQQASQFNAGQDQQAAMFNSSGTAAQQLAQAGFRQDANQYNAGQQQQNSQFNATQQNAVAAQQAAFNQQASQYNAGQQQQNSQFNATQGQQNSQFNAGQQNQVIGQANQFAGQQALGNAGYEQQSRSEGASNALQAQMANQGAGLQANQQALAAGGQLAGMGAQQQQMQANNVNMLNSLGTQQQQNTQAGLDFDYGQFQRQLNDPYQKLQALTSATGSMSAPQPVQSGKGQAASNMSSKLSDERLKTNIVDIGRDRRGRRIIEWEYLTDLGKRVMGYSAQDLLKTDPHAVRQHPFGFLVVDYDMLEAA